MGLISLVIYGIYFLEIRTVTVPEEGGVYREGSLTQPIYINPVITNANDTDKDLIALVYSSLFDLADKITISKDNKTWTIRLRESVMWHDGTRLTSDDVIFTIQAMQDPEARSSLFVTWQGVAIERTSELELTLTTGAPYAFFEENLKRLYIMPRHIFETVPVENWRLSNFNLEPIGSGPYRVAGFKKEQNGFISKYILERNDAFFGKPPYINKIEFNFYVNENDLIRALNTATIDAAAGINPTRLIDLTRARNVYISLLPRYYSVFLNQNANEILRKYGVRKALLTAIDTEKIIQETFAGEAAVTVSPVPRELVKDTIASVYNPAGAEEMLEQMNLPKGEDGVRGNIRLVIPNVDFLVKTGEIVAASWDAIGIKTELAIIDPATVAAEVIRTRNYDAILFGNVPVSNEDLFSFWHSSERFYPGLNLALWNNKEADRIMERVRKEFDKEVRTKDLQSLAALIDKDVPAIFLYSPNYIIVIGNRIKGISIPPNISLPSRRFQNISEWYINTQRTFTK